MKHPEICVCSHLKHLLLHRKSECVCHWLFLPQYCPQFHERVFFAVVIMRIVTLIHFTQLNYILKNRRQSQDIAIVIDDVVIL